MAPFRQMQTSTRYGSRRHGLGLAFDGGFGRGEPRGVLDQERARCRDPGGNCVFREQGAGGVGYIKLFQRGFRGLRVRSYPSFCHSNALGVSLSPR